MLLGWLYGQSYSFSKANDVPSGDFYGGCWQQRFGTKLLAAFEIDQPFEYMTSRCVTLYDHTSTKSDAEMARSYATTLANGGTHLLIDAINPDGTLEPRFYQRVQGIARSPTWSPSRTKWRSFDPKLVADVGLYYGLMSSLVRRDHNGQSLPVDHESREQHACRVTDLKPLQEVIGTSTILNLAKIPYRVVTEGTSDFF